MSLCKWFRKIQLQQEVRRWEDELTRLDEIRITLPTSTIIIERRLARAQQGLEEMERT